MTAQTAYGMTILTICSICPSFMAAQYYVRWLVNSRVPFWIAYAVFLALIVVAGMRLLGSAAVIGAVDPASLSIAVPVGFLFGIMAFLADQRIVHSVVRRLSLNGPGEQASSGFALTPLEIAPVRRLWLAPAQHRIVPFEKTRTAQAAGMGKITTPEVNVASAVLIGALEELVYRGVLLVICFQISNPYLYGLAITFSLVAFSLSHLHYGWFHVLAKFPLGLLALIGTLMTGGVAIAIVSHVSFNLLIYWKLSRVA